MWRVPELFGGSMKKILTVALVALLAAGTAFAGFSGNANIKLGYDFTSGKYGFEKGTGFDVKFLSKLICLSILML